MSCTGGRDSQSGLVMTEGEPFRPRGAGGGGGTVTGGG